jgi:hypothetical protein
MTKKIQYLTIKKIVRDPDPYDFGPPGSGSFHQQEKINLDLCCLVTS